MKPDIADIIAGELGISRATAYDLMREALKDTEQPAQGCNCGQGQCCHVCDPDIANGLAQPAQEPIYLIWDDWEGNWYQGHQSEFNATPEDSRWLVYPAPQQRPWVGLTDEENRICLGFNKVLGLQYQEAKLKEKNT